MSAQSQDAIRAEGPSTGQGGTPGDYEAIVVGAGFGGLRMLHALHAMGVKCCLIEAGSDVGGTWYWNRYPGSRTDSEAWAYCYSFSKELMTDWVWPERMPTWEQVQAYLAHVADRFDLRRDIRFNTHIASARFDDATNQWTLLDDSGAQWRCKYFISAMGWFANACEIPVPGRERFKGELYMSAFWPKTPVDFTGKRIGIVGAGSTAVQILPIVAKTAAHVSLFQRTPNYVMPGRNYPLDESDMGGIKANYDAIWQQVRSHVFAFPMTTSTLTYDSVDDAERERIFEAGWETGGFRFLFETFGDILTDQRSNDAAAAFIRRKIHTIVRDQKTADLLCPDYPFALKRPPLGNFYYETFNRPNVSLVDVRNSPITEITETGLRTATQAHDFDMLIFAIGFDAVTGSLTKLDIRGRTGQTIRDKWANGPRTHLGIAIDEFPNLFMITGPQTPFSNVPPVIESSVGWISQAMQHMRRHNLARMEAQPEAVERWAQLMWDYLNATILGGAVNQRSWYMGANIPGKTHAPMNHFGGSAAYFADIDRSLKEGFPGFDFTPAPQPASAVA